MNVWKCVGKDYYYFSLLDWSHLQDNTYVTSLPRNFNQLLCLLYLRPLQITIGDMGIFSKLIKISLNSTVDPFYTEIQIIRKGESPV